MKLGQRDGRGSSDLNATHVAANLFSDLRMMSSLMSEEWLSKIPNNCGEITISLEGEIGGQKKTDQFSMKQPQEMEKNILDFIALRSRTESNNVSNVKCVIQYSTGYLYREITPNGETAVDQAGEGSYQLN